MERERTPLTKNIVTTPETPERNTEYKHNFVIPETPALRTLGYGTGVGVYHLERSPCEVGKRSPWALKKVLRQHTHMGYEKLINDEASILRSLDHPNIVGFRGLTETVDGRAVLAMEECSRSLGDVIEERRETGLSSFPAVTIRRVAADVASALDYLHCKVRIMHGDIKSYNVLIKGDFDAVKLCDFGVSVKLDEKGFAVGNYIGTGCWTAPEALLNENVTAKSDMFAFGLLLWEMITLTPPHLGDDDDDLDVTVCSEDECSSYGTRPALPSSLPAGEGYDTVLELFNRCTEQSPDARPTARQVLEALEAEGEIRP